jgi:hypothetical protein
MFNFVLRLGVGVVRLSQEPLPQMPDELRALFQERK